MTDGIWPTLVWDLVMTAARTSDRLRGLHLHPDVDHLYSAALAVAEHIGAHGYGEQDVQDDARGVPRC